MDNYSTGNYPQYLVMGKNLKKDYIGLPWWSSGEEPAVQSRGHQFAAWAGKIPCSTGQVSLWATLLGPCSTALKPWSPCPATNKPPT